MSPRERRRPRRVPAALRQAEATRAVANPASAAKQPRIATSHVFAFSLGLVVMGFAFGAPVITAPLFFIGVLGTSFGLSRVFGLWLASRRRT